METKTYKFEPLDKVLSFEKHAKMLGVSKKARSPSGFLTEYKRVKDPSLLSSEWINKRNAFLDRHIPQYTKNPTLRHWLAIMMWAFKPSTKPRVISTC